MDNPWITQACEQHDVSPNRLDTHLQEQYGQLAEDLVLDALLKSYFHRHRLDADRIRYLEIGANHPVQTSNTYLFHNKWKGRGVLVEANSALVPALRRVRTRDVVLNYAVVPAGHPAVVELNVAENAELSSLDRAHVESFGDIGSLAGTLQVETVTLDELLDNCFPEGLHLLSIDIEGMDLPVLEGAALRRRPVFIVAEPSRHYFEDAEQSFARVLTQHRYVEVARTDFNIIYLDRAVSLDG